MSSSTQEVQTVQCKCETTPEGECVCVYQVACDSCTPGETRILNLECSGRGDERTACRGQFELKCNCGSGAEEGTDTYVNVSKCEGCVCRFELQKPKNCSVIRSEIDCSNCPKTCGKGGGCCKN